MLIQENLVLTRIEPNGNGGTQFIYRVKGYGIAAISYPKEDISLLDWSVDVVKFQNEETLAYEICHSTDLAQKTLTFKNDKTLNEFLQKAFDYFRELDTLEGMMG